MERNAGSASNAAGDGCGRARSDQAGFQPYQGKLAVRDEPRGRGKRRQDLMAVCHDARKGRAIGIHWSKPVAPPLHSTSITAVFLVGVFWKRASGRAAFVTMVFGAAMGAVCFAADFFKSAISGDKGFLPKGSALAAAFDWFTQSVLGDFMLASFGMFCICVLVQIISSLVRARTAQGRSPTAGLEPLDRCVARQMRRWPF